MSKIALHTVDARSKLKARHSPYWVRLESGCYLGLRKTGKGKIMREQANNQHMYEQKTSRRKRRLRRDQVLSPADTKIAKRLLGDR